MYGLIFIISVVICFILAWYALMFQTIIPRKEVEGFTTQTGLNFLSNNTENECPLSAERGSDGKILVQPQNRKFDSMPDYVAWLSSLSTAGSMCVPPYVKGPSEVEMIQPGDRITGPDSKIIQTQNKSGNVFTTQVEGEQTSAKTPIDKVDDYEYTRIFQNENSARGQLSKANVNSLITEKQLDWSNLPFNSEDRARGESDFLAERADSAHRDPKTGVFFKGISGADLAPPDEDEAEIREKAALKSYEPSSATSLLEHNTEDIAEMVKKMYAEDPNWEPVVEKVGDNQFRVTELRPKPRKEKWAENQDMTVERAKADALVDAKVDVEGGNNDPYFDKQGVIDYSNNRFWEYKDFKKWTPGLERMFAPTLDTTNWL